MSTTTLRWLDGNGKLKVVPASDAGDIDDALAGAETWAWIDVVDPDHDTLEALRRRFDFHELSVEDSEHQQHRAKLDQYPSGLFVVWLTPQQPRGDQVATTELDVFVGKRYLVTLHAGTNAAIDAVVRDADCATSALAAGPAWVLHKVIDLLVDSTLPLVDKVGEQLDAIEDKMLGNPRQEDLRTLHRVRRQLMRLHRIIAPERDMLRGLARESDVISADAYAYFQDVGDHLARALDSIETYQDVGASVMDVYLSAQSNRMNEIMKQLTVVATIFMPLTLITGIYGMNLTSGMWPPPGDAARWSFGSVMLAMLALSLGMAAYFRKKNWW